MTHFLNILRTATLALIVLMSGSTQAATNTEKSAASKPHSVKAGKPRKATPVEPTVSADEEIPDISTAKAFEYRCELGNALTMYINSEDTERVTMRWRKGLYRLTKAATSTGAVRFESQRAGLVWIGIPAKSMLLDARKGQQLANECMTPTAAADASATLPATQPN